MSKESPSQNSSETSSSIDRKRALLQAAMEAVCGDRALNYGDPEDNFERIKVMWNAWFMIHKEDPRDRVGDVFLAPWEITILMILMKVARLANQPIHNDSWIDIAGYAACGADITRSGVKVWRE